MFDWHKILVDGLIYSVIGSAYLVLMLAIDNRMFLNPGDYPEDVLAAVPPRTKKETRKAMLLGIPWFIWAFAFPLYSTLGFAEQASPLPGFITLFAHAFLIFFSFWLVDLVILDGLMFCLITPSFVVIPGTEGFPGYKDFRMHLRGHFGKGLAYLAVSGAIVAAIVWLIKSL
jgi:hypothetical protein